MCKASEGVGICEVSGAGGGEAGVVDLGTFSPPALGSRPPMLPLSHLVDREETRDGFCGGEGSVEE